LLALLELKRNDQADRKMRRPMSIEVGAKYLAKGTTTNTTFGIKPDSPCWITFVEAAHVSFYAQRSPVPGAGWVKARATKEIFGLNFRPDPFSQPNLGYRAGRPETTPYP
jgi:hypothetical protein